MERTCDWGGGLSRWSGGGGGGRVEEERGREGRTNFVFLAEFLVEGGAHDGAADAGGGGEVRFARFAARAVEVWWRSWLVGLSR